MEDEVDTNPEFDALISAAIATAEKDLADDPEPSESTEDTEDTADQETDTDVSSEQEAETGKPDETLARVVAREEAIAKREAEYDAKLAELRKVADSYKNAVSVDDLRKMGENPIELLDKIGLDKDFIMDVLVSEKLGDKAPAALKEKVRDYKLKREIESIKAERDAERRMAEARSYYDKISAETKSYVTTGVDSKSAPTVSLVVKTDPDFVHGLVLRELENDARMRAARGETDGDLMPYADAIANIEKMLAVVAKSVRAGETTKMKPAGTKKIPPVTKPRDRSVDEITDLEQKGIDAALKLLGGH
jgi:hypothetical protein